MVHKQAGAAWHFSCITLNPKRILFSQLLQFLHMNKLILSAGLAFSLCTLSQCATNPVTGKRQVALISEEQEVAMGREADPAIVAQYGLYEDKDLQAFINEKGKQMGAISHRPNLDYQFRIVNSEVLNAFAVPGGYVYFTRGIMAHFNSEADFAGVLGHEIGHITARHSVQQQSRQVLGQIGLVGAMILSPTVAQYGQAAQQGLGLLFLKYGRDAERQSDELGVEYSSKIGYDARQMAQFFQTLQRQSQASGAQELPDFLSTHPNPGDREVTVQRLATQWQQRNNATNLQVNRNAYLRRIDGIVFGEDPREGFRENGIFYHPTLRFQFATPTGWRYQNTPQAVQLAEPNGNALMIFTLAPGSDLRSAAQQALQKYSLQAIESRDVQVNGFPALAVVADQVAQQGQQQQQAIRTLNYFIQDGNTIYHFIGVSAPAGFNNYASLFNNTFQSFQRLTDASKLNRQPQRVRIRTANSNTTLAAALRSQGMPEARMNELAILNGMQLNDNLPAGTLYKIVQ